MDLNVGQRRDIFTNEDAQNELDKFLSNVDIEFIYELSNSYNSMNDLLLDIRKEFKIQFRTAMLLKEKLCNYKK